MFPNQYQERAGEDKKYMRILVTGGAGFIGSNFIKYILSKYDYTIVNYDNLTYAGNLQNLRTIENNSNYHFVLGDIRNDPILINTVCDYGVDTIVNFAAETHVDRSIDDPEVFVKSNVNGTYNLVSLFFEDFGIQKYIQISTDEVYGELTDSTSKFTEETPIEPNSPYSATKASADLICRSFFETYGFPIIITRCSNNYGEDQYPEKLIPLMIDNAINDEKLPVYGSGDNVRDWIHVLDHCEAIDTVLHKGRNGEVYNIGGNCEKTNLEIIEIILKELGKSKDLIEFVEDRPGHDWRYAMDISKIQNELGWTPKISLEDGLRKLIKGRTSNV